MLKTTDLCNPEDKSLKALGIIWTQIASKTLTKGNSKILNMS